MKFKLLLGLAAYGSTSYFFLKNPELLHKRKNKLKVPHSDQSMYIITHRGGSMECPENTLQAF